MRFAPAARDAVWNRPFPAHTEKSTESPNSQKRSIVVRVFTERKNNMNPTVPGIHHQVRLFKYSGPEREIIQRISREWYVTNGGDEITLGAATYRYILMKPTPIYQEMFNLERELIVIFSHYPVFQPRTLDAIDAVITNYQALRVERICSVIIGKDPQTENKLRDLLKSDEEAQIIVPFTYDELRSNQDEFFIRNRFKKHFYTRDLFAFESPLKKDLYFFGMVLQRIQQTIKIKA